MTFVKKINHPIECVKLIVIKYNFWRHVFIIEKTVRNIVRK